MHGPGRKEFNAQRALNYKEQQKAIAGVQKSQQQLSTWQSAEVRKRVNDERTVSREAARTHQAKQRQIDQISRSQASLARQRSREEAAAHQVAQRRVDFIRSTVGGAAGKVFGTVAAVGKAGIAAAGLGGGAVAAASINQALTLEEGSRRLMINARGRGQTGYDADTLRKQFTQTGIQFGLAPEDIMAGVTKYVASTGDLKGALANKDMLATVAQGEGADVSSIFQGAAIMGKQMGVKDPKDVAKAFTILTMQGKKGSFELKNAATELPETLAAAAGAGLHGVAGVRDVGTMLQLAQDSTENGAESGTAVANMFRQIKKKAKGIQDGSILGKKVNIYEDGDLKKGMRTDTPGMLTDIVSATGGDESKIQDLFDIRGNKAFQQITNAYKGANIAAGGGKAGDIAGRAAVEKKWNEYANVSSDFREIQRDAADAMKSTSVQLEILNTKLKDAVASQLFPAFQRLVPELEKIIPLVGQAAEAFVNLISFLANNPLSGLGSIIAAFMMVELGKAALGDIVGKMLLAIVARLPTGTGGPLTTVPSIPGMPIPTTTGGKILQGVGKAAAGAAAGGLAGYEIGQAIGGDEWGKFGGLTGGGAGAGFMLGGPLGALLGFSGGMIADATTDLKKAGGGWDFWNADKNFDKQAKEEYAARMASSGGGDGSGGSPQEAAQSAAQKLDEFTKSLGEATLKLDKFGAIKPNTGDKPTGVK